MSDAINLLRSIDSTLKQMLGLMQQREAKVRASRPKEVASDRELDGKYGDPKVRLSPRDWTGEPCKGRQMSECPAEFLDLLADTLDYFADKEEREGTTYNGKPTAPYKRKDAARARGWVKRIRDGKHAPRTTSAPAMDGLDAADYAPDGWAADADGWESEASR